MNYQQRYIEAEKLAIEKFKDLLKSGELFYCSPTIATTFENKEFFFSTYQLSKVIGGIDNPELNKYQLKKEI